MNCSPSSDVDVMRALNKYVLEFSFIFLLGVLFLCYNINMRSIRNNLILSFIIFTLIVPVHAAGSNEKELFVVAQRAFEDGFYDVSLRYVDQLFKDFPRNSKAVEARLLEGQCYFFKKQYLKAFTVFQDLVKRGEYKDVSLFWLGETYLKVGDAAKAREQYRQIIDGYPNSLYAPQAYYSMGWSFFEKAGYDEAGKSFLKFVELFFCTLTTCLFFFANLNFFI